MTATSQARLDECRHLFLRGLTRQVNIGIHEFERRNAQRIIFDIDFYVPLAFNTPMDDNIEEVVDYDFVRSVVSNAIECGHIELQETLCDRIVDALLRRPKILAVRVSTRKPDVYEDCEGVGVEVLRFKSDLLLTDQPT